MKEKFIDKAREIHGDRYDYSLVNYINNKTKVQIICKIHGIFEQTPSKHTNSRQGCKLCNKPHFTTKDIIELIKKYHGNEYDYQYVDYKNYTTKIKLVCKKHGIFYKTLQHLHTKCQKCNYDKYKNDIITLINTANKIHNNKYDYSLVEYSNNKTKVKIICPIHGIFEQTINMHINRKQGCPRCVNKNKTTEIFIEESRKIHGHKYDYSLVEYKNTGSKVEIICPIHGIFYKSPNKHLTGEGCPICSESKGQRKIRLFLEEKKIKFILEKRFINCKFKNTLPFDFYLPDYNMCIEFDGLQHFEPVEYWGGEKNFLQIQIRDKIKNEYCFNNNIHLLRIKYNENISEKLKISIPIMTN